MADGVGGWRNYGIDPSAFPQTLMRVCKRIVREGRFVPQSPASLIIDSYNEMLEQKVELLGKIYCYCSFVLSWETENAVLRLNDTVVSGS